MRSRVTPHVPAQQAPASSAANVNGAGGDASLATPPLRGRTAPAQSNPKQEADAAAAAAQQALLLSEILAARRFDLHNPPPPSVPVFAMAGATICTPGNISGLQAQVKSGKSAVVGAMIASTMNPTGDCLGFTSENSKGLAVVHFDTEQCPADHHEVMRTALRRAGTVDQPAWLRSYRLADVSTENRRKIIAFEIERAAADHGGIHSVFLDGLADFTPDPNNTEEAFAFIAELHQLAIRYSTVIVCVLHENPGSETGKTRGHLGSQLERKAESNLRLAKDGETITAYTERARHAHVTKDRGPRFQWNHEAGMHLSTARAAETKANERRQEEEEFVAELFKGCPASVGLSHTDLLGRIQELAEPPRGREKLSWEGAISRRKKYSQIGLIRQNGGKWFRA